jgi:hypothetical protein
MRRLRSRLGLKGFTGIDSNGKSGGLALFWHEHLLVDVQEVTDRYIDIHIQVNQQEPRWRLTCVYGEPRVENRQQMWDKLRALKPLTDLPWCVLGDFNEAMWAFEHFSATPRPESQMRNFREALEVCELIDLGFSGLAYTYDNKRSGSANVQVRLDRAVADNSWRNLFAEARVVHKVTPCSDHYAIILECIKEEFQGPRPARRYYEVMWERDASLPERVATAWAETGPKHNLGEVKKGLGCVMSQLQAWSKAKFGAVTRELEKAGNRLSELMNMNADRMEIRDVTDKMNELLYREEMMWLQRSRIDWLRDGHRNTKFFH